MQANALLSQKKVEILNQLPQEYKTFFKWFLAITEVYRPSGHLDQARETVIQWATTLGVSHKVDPAGNTIFTIPATKGKEGVKPICLQGHLDMVAVGKFDEKGRVNLKIENGCLTSGVSSIGADDGVSIAAMFTIMENKDNFAHGTIECLVTMDEEIGLIGASKLQGPPFIQSRSLVNLDSEEWGIFYTSCAGGMNVWYEYLVHRAEFQGRALKLTVKDFVSGHTGLMIGEGRHNAVKWMVRLLLDAKRRGIEYRLIDIQGGEKHNAIPASCTANLVVKGNDFEAAIQELHNTAVNESKAIEVKIPKLLIEAATSTVHPMTAEDTHKVLNLLACIHHGVWNWHPEIKDLIQTSQSMSVVRFEGDNLKVQVFARTNESSHMQWLMNQNTALAELAGVKVSIPVEEMSGPWPAALSSKIMDVAKETYVSLNKSEPHVAGIHAGLECGVIQNRGYSDLEAVSFGPTVKGAHTEEESVSIDTACKFYELTLEIVKNWAK